MTQPEQPLALLVRDIAADFGVAPLAVCKALNDLGFGPHSVNMAVTDAMARRLREHFPQPAPATDMEDPVTVPRGLLGAACYAIDHKRDAPRVLEQLRRYTVGDLSQPAPAQAVPTERGWQPRALMAEQVLREIVEHVSQSGDHTPESFRRGMVSLMEPAHKILRAAAAALVAQAERAGRPDIIERLSYHALERDDLSLDDCLSYLSAGWKTVHGRTERQMVMQILALLAVKDTQGTTA